MIRIRPANARGHFDHGWLDTHHTFSFGDYRDPEQMGFRALRVINEDRVEPGQGFGMHPHANMEIITYVLEGALEHKDSMNNGEVLRAGELQRMSAGTGLMHSEFNPSATEPVHLYQIWLRPDRKNIEPSYEQRRFAFEPGQRLRLVASPDGREQSLRIQQDARVLLASLAAGEDATYALAQDRHAWVQVLLGSVTVNGHSLAAGDGAAVSGEPAVTLEAGEAAEVMLFDLA